MSENERHTMLLVNRDDNGIEEWFCPICGRRFLMTWPPDYSRTILEPGDETAIHVGGKSFAEFSDLLHLETGEVTIDRSDPRLKPFEDFLKGLNDFSPKLD